MTEIQTEAVFRGIYKNLARIAEFVRKSSRKAGFNDAAIYEIETAVDEACSNIIEHGYGGEDIGDIKCTCIIDNKGLTIVLNDQGQPFVPKSIPAPDIDAPLEERSNHGLGLYFMQQMMDEINFSYEKITGNTITLTKYRS